MNFGDASGSREPLMRMSELVGVVEDAVWFAPSVESSRSARNAPPAKRAATSNDAAAIWRRPEEKGPAAIKDTWSRMDLSQWLDADARLCRRCTRLEDALASARSRS